MTRHHRFSSFDHLGIALGALLVGFIVPGHLIAQSPHDFAHLSASWLRNTALMLSGVAAAGGLALYWSLQLLNWRRFASGLVWFVAIWTSTAGLVVPIVGRAELVDMAAMPLSAFGLTVAAALTAGLLWLSQSRYRRFLVVYLGVMLVTTIAGEGERYAEAFFGRDHARPQAFATLSAKRNILVISFDGVSGPLTDALLRAKPGLAAPLRDFTLYNEAIANSPATDSSLRAELFGDRDYKAIGQSDDVVRRHLDPAELPLNHSDIDAMTYAMYNPFAKAPTRRVEIGHLARSVDPLTRAADTLAVYRYLAVRLVGPISVRLFNALGARGVDGAKFLRNAIGGKCRNCGSLADRLLNHQGADWDRPLISTIADVDGLVDRLQLGPSAFSLRYMHFAFSHHPVDFDAACHYRADDPDWVNTHQNEAGARSEAECVLTRLNGILRRLKAIGAYDNSLIVVKSDHGAPASYFASPPESYQINGHPLWGYDRYRPLLMIKPIGGHSPTMSRSDRLTPLSDLAVTLCRRIPRAGNCAAFPGFDILSPGAASGRYRIYIVPDSNATHSYGTHVERSLPRDRPLLESLVAAGDIVPSSAAAAP